MEILSHRGYWVSDNEKNTVIAFKRSFDLGFGTETDLRDFNSKIVVSHDIANKSSILFEDLLDIMGDKNLKLALNIKADGLIYEILSILEKYHHTNYFTFDMSIPDMVVQSQTTAKFYTGLSDLLKEPILLEKSCGVWLDSFYSDWFGANEINSILSKGKAVCIVSSDLHKRQTDYQWDFLKKSQFIHNDKVCLCTDKIQEAMRFFYEKD